MGRVSKYTTLDERIRANKEQNKKYSQTKSAKALRKEQNRRAYQRLTEGQNNLRPTWPTIPRAVHKMAALPIPRQSHFFVLEFRAREAISDDDPLAKWDFYPPYHVPQNTIAAGRLDAIEEGLHGCRLREQYQHEAEHLRRYEKQTDKEILEEIGRDINTHLVAWHDLKRIIGSFQPGDIDHTMGQHLMQWKARRVIDLKEDWKVVKKGRADEAFICHFAKRW